MRAKLSHSLHRLFEARLTRRLRSVVGFASLAFLVTASVGCENVEGDGMAGLDAADRRSDEFEWPADPSHPVLALEIDSPSVAGTVHIELMPELAPVTVAAIIERASRGHYDGTTFHRVIRGFMIQGGDPNSRDRDPTNDGRGGSDTLLLDEFGEAPFLRGVVGVGNKGRQNSNGIQLFIMHEDDRTLDGHYTAIGRVIDGLEIVDAITNVATDKVGRWGPKDRPIENIVMKEVSLAGQIGAMVSSGKIKLADADGAATREAGLDRGSTSASAFEEQSLTASNSERLSR